MRRVVVSWTNTTESILLPMWHARCPANGTEPIESCGVALKRAPRDYPQRRRGPREMNRRTAPPPELFPPSIDKFIDSHPPTLNKLTFRNAANH